MTEQLQTEIDEFKKENMKTKIKCEIMLFNIFNCIFFTEKQIQNFDKRHQKSLFFKISLIILSEFDRESHNKHWSVKTEERVLQCLRMCKLKQLKRKNSNVKIEND